MSDDASSNQKPVEPSPKIVVRSRRRATAPPPAPSPEDAQAPPGASDKPEPASAPEPDHKVGYGRPPVEHQFRKNVSGNPNGRPPRAKGFKPQLRKVLAASMPAKINGRTVYLSRQEIICLALVDKAARGDMRALKLLIDLDPIAQDALAKGVSSAVDAALDAEDEAMLGAYLRTLTGQGGNDPEDEQ